MLGPLCWHPRCQRDKDEVTLTAPCAILPTDATSSKLLERPKSRYLKMARNLILAVCAIALLISVQQASAGGARQLNAEIQESFAEKMTTRNLLDNNVPANLLGGSTGSATVSNTGNGSGVGGSGASGSGASNTGQDQATSGAALAPGSIAPASG